MHKKDGSICGIDIGITTGYTSPMKTAISVPDAIFNEVDKVAKESHSSRSEVFVTAVREYLEKRKSRKLLDDLNNALAVAETAEEYAGRQKIKKQYGRVVRKERW
jgi:metal-responsive CopG/Arc/MetJ family transcriptional regulator